jgi:hypothetical protein
VIDLEHTASAVVARGECEARTAIGLGDGRLHHHAGADVKLAFDAVTRSRNHHTPLGPSTKRTSASQ